LRALIVDDYRFFRETLKTRLLDYFPSMIIHEAINGKEALEKINQMPPHLVFMDICLPGSNGLQLTRTVKKYYPNLKIAMLTSYDFPRGKNNLADPARILPSGGTSFLAECRDADIDDEFMIHRRGGFGAPVFSGGGIHSLWSNGDICLFVQGADLKRLNPDYTATTILPVMGSGRMVYVDVAGTVYLTNGTIIGYLQGDNFQSFPNPEQTYKSPMVPGHLIEYFNGRLYVARDNEIWFSDPMALMRTDRRRNFKQLSSRITLFSSVEDGIYVSDLEKTYFMGGGDPGEAVLIDKADYPAIPHTAQKIDAARIEDSGLSGSVVLWASKMGICLGAKQGQFKNLTEERFRLQGKPSSGSSMVRKEKAFYQFVSFIET